eukprot:scaffold5516_cov105-Cylindrotheca_fusiformis.AAC.4
MVWARSCWIAWWRLERTFPSVVLKNREAPRRRPKANLQTPVNIKDELSPKHLLVLLRGNTSIQSIEERRRVQHDKSGLRIGVETRNVGQNDNQFNTAASIREANLNGY